MKIDTNESPSLDSHDWKGNVIDYLIRNTNYNSYLELGVSVLGESWLNVSCENKVGVDTDRRAAKRFPGVVCETTDSFFEKNSQKYDLIFIDALHEKNQVKRDFLNSLKCLNENGVILLHDINPLMSSGARPRASGNVYEFWIDLSSIAELYTITNAEQDCLGVFISSSDDKIKDVDLKTYSHDFFNENRDKYIKEKNISIKDLVKTINLKNLRQGSVQRPSHSKG